MTRVWSHPPRDGNTFPAVQETAGPGDRIPGLPSGANGIPSRKILPGSKKKSELVPAFQYPPLPEDMRVVETVGAVVGMVVVTGTMPEAFAAYQTPLNPWPFASPGF
jgi:hypothetical protein